ncbi:Uncharacterised protein [Escherichia coli]|nr:Uncharacterised protein [Escherichia coli]CAD5853658.1 Uncharacterised protein [Escherichia coli]CAD6115207.1 Uncharacterised protein [Escherichia coli]
MKIKFLQNRKDLPPVIQPVVIKFNYFKYHVDDLVGIPLPN